MQLFYIAYTTLAAMVWTIATPGQSVQNIRKFLENTTEYFLDPIPSRNSILTMNNLKHTSPSNVKHYVHYAFAVYCSDKLVTWTCTSCRILGPTVRYITEVGNRFTDAKAFFAIDDIRQEIVVSFRGASNIHHLIFVSKFSMLKVKPNSDIRVHFGFYMGTISLYSKVIQKLKKLTDAHPNYKVVMTGHSKGGAEAALTIFLFKTNNIFVNISFELYTYGEPRIGNRAFAEYFNSLSFPVARVVHNADVMPHIISPAGLGYVHHQNEVWVVNNIAKNCSTKTYEDEQCSNSRGPKFSLSDHFHYFEADYANCPLEEPVKFALQAVINLKLFLPQGLLGKLALY